MTALYPKRLDNIQKPPVPPHLRVDCASCVAERHLAAVAKLSEVGSSMLEEQLAEALRGLRVIEQNSYQLCGKHRIARPDEARELRRQNEDLLARLEQQEERHTAELAERARLDERDQDEATDAEASHG